ncbi:hypothetical protein DSM106972_080870 [Dulcicalothrix desertica PCC 7102]|uniref:Uncharacterized protein n=1 Tax=Dulcicalothrix desertica PCC 7102 TaxID=232991 RepID=A0A3S1C7R2_9CYAN|nr:hypothetical protein [Dulcicalothrix desertica]RUS98458.1 hypothetical protein DSM106972_080870 [Dulcicalothrix desertica PCC 7102]
MTPFFPCHQEILDKFLTEFWDYYRELLAYRDSPSEKRKLELASKFWEIFGTKSGYEQLDERRNISYATQTTQGTLILGHFYVSCRDYS